MLRHLVTALALLAAGTAQASTLKLVPSTATPVKDSSFTVNLVLDATDAEGNHPGLHSGEIIIDFNRTLLDYTSYTLGAGVNLVPVGATPVTAVNGNTETLQLWFENAPDVGTVATFSFLAIGQPGSQATLGLVDADDMFGSFVNKAGTDHRFFPVLTGTQVSISAVPLPAGIWLLGTAVGALVVRRFRHAAA